MHDANTRGAWKVCLLSYAIFLNSGQNIVYQARKRLKKKGEAP